MKEEEREAILLASLYEIKGDGWYFAKVSDEGIKIHLSYITDDEFNNPKRDFNGETIRESMLEFMQWDYNNPREE